MILITICLHVSTKIRNVIYQAETVGVIDFITISGFLHKAIGYR